MYNSVKQGPLIFVPGDFDAAGILKNVKSNKTGKKRNVTFIRSVTDAMYYILHTIIQMDRRQDKRQEIDNTGYFGLSSKILQENCGKYYAYAARLLKSNGVIGVDPSYQVGKKHKGYCLVGDYASAETKVVALSKGGTTEKKHLERYHKTEKENNIELDKIPFITKWYDKDRLKVDIEKSHNFIEFYKKKLIGHIPTGTDPGNKNNIENSINTRYNCAISNVKRIARGDFDLYRLGRDQRLHSSITSLMKEFRSFLLYDGEPLIGVDIKSSQPYLLTQLLKPSTYDPGHPLSIASLYPELYSAVSGLAVVSHTINDTINNIIMLITYPSTNTGILQRNFLDIDWTDDFYEELIDLESKMGIPDKKRVFKMRTEVKRNIMTIFYLKKWTKRYLESWKRFAALFPVEASLIQYFSDLSRKDESNYLPIFLQRLESKLMLDIVCRAISEKLPDAPIIPIHDSILTKEIYVPEVREIIRSTLFELTGVEPGLKLDNKSPEKVLDELLETVKIDFEEIISNPPKEINTYTLKSKQHLLNQLPKLKEEAILWTGYLDPSEEEDIEWQD